MYTYVARQPILDLSKNTIGYELLFRDGPKKTLFHLLKQKKQRADSYLIIF